MSSLFLVLESILFLVHFFSLQISLVSQEPVLFARSIADNISYGLDSVPYESIVQAAQKANAHTFVTELQDGYQTGIGNLPLCV